MDENYTDSLLSAFCDGEASPDECAEARRRIDASAEGRRENSEIQKLSGLLKSLPRESLPSEFASKVMQAAERESLLSSVKPADTTSDAAKARTGWRYAVATLTATAAAIVVMTWALAPAPDEMQIAGTRTSGSLSSETSSSPASDELAKSSGEFLNGVLFDKAANEVALKGSLSFQLDADSKDFAPPSTETAEALGAAGTAPDAMVFRRTLKDARLGEVIEALDTTGAEITVVRLTVVDRTQGLQSLQFLLQKNRIPEQTLSLDSDSDLATEKADDSDRLLAVYVETEPDVMSSTLNQLKTDQQIREVDIQGPIQVAELDRESQMKLGWGWNRAAESAVPLSAPEAPLARAAGGAESRDRSTAVPVGRGSPASAARSKDEPLAKNLDEAKKTPVNKDDASLLSDKSQSVVRARRFELFVDAKILQQKPGKPTESRSAAPSKELVAKRKQETLAATPPTSSVEAADSLQSLKAKDSRTVQVLFVLVDSASNSTRRPAAPAPARVPQNSPAKPKPDCGAA